MTKTTRGMMTRNQPPLPVPRRKGEKQRRLMNEYVDTKKKAGDVEPRVPMPSTKVGLHVARDYDYGSIASR